MPMSKGIKTRERSGIERSYKNTVSRKKARLDKLVMKTLSTPTTIPSSGLAPVSRGRITWVDRPCTSAGGGCRSIWVVFWLDSEPTTLHSWSVQRRSANF